MLYVGQTDIMDVGFAHSYSSPQKLGAYFGLKGISLAIFVFCKNFLIGSKKIPRFCCIMSYVGQMDITDVGFAHSYSSPQKIRGVLCFFKSRVKIESDFSSAHPTRVLDP